MNKDVWDVLQLKEGATKKEIRRQYAKLSRACHPEEEPEKFAELQNAYQKALELCESSASPLFVDEEPVAEKLFDKKLFHEESLSEKIYDKELCDDSAGFENEIYEAPSTPLVDKLYEKEENAFEQYISSGIIKTISDALADRKKKNKPATWQEIFLTDKFLDEQFTEQFADGMRFIFEQMPEITNVNEVPSAFLTELAIAYGIEVNSDGHISSIGRDGVEGVLAHYWFQMPEEWYEVRATGYLKKIQNRVRAITYARYRMLLFMDDSAFLNESESLKWEEIIWKLDANSCYENGVANATSSKILIRLCSYWLSHYRVPDHVITYIYRRLHLDSIDTISCKEWYVPLKDCIEANYPQLECLDTEKGNTKELFVSKYMPFISLTSDLIDDYRNGNAFDETTFAKKNKEFFDSDIWKMHAKNPVVINYLAENFNAATKRYETADIMFYTYYNPDQWYDESEDKLLEMLIRSRYFSRKEFDVNIDKRAQYILMYGYGIRKLQGAKIYDRYGFYESNGALNLMLYMDYLFSIGDDCEYEGEQYECAFSDGNRMEYLPEHNHVSVRWNGNDVHGNILSAEQLLTYEKELSDAGSFFALLSIMDRSDVSLYDEIRKCIDKWLRELELTANIRSKIIDCILKGGDEIEQLGDYVICTNGNKTLYMADCKGEFIPYLFSPRGLTMLPQFAGANKASSLEEAKEAYMIPMPELIKTYDLEGKSEAEIWDIIFEGFVLNGKINSIRCDTPEEEYDKEYVKAYMEREGKYIQNVFVVLSGSVRKEDNGPLSISLFGNGVCNMNSYYQYDEKAEKLLAAVSDKYHENGVAIGWVASAYNQCAMQPIVLGESGKLYIRNAIKKLLCGNSIKDVLKAHIHVMQYTKVEVYANVLSWSRFENTFDYCFKIEDYEAADSLANYYGMYHFDDDSIIDQCEEK